jgi:hypothetical protein
MMRAALLVLLALVAGCAAGPSSSSSCGATVPDGHEGSVVTVHFLNDGNLAGRLCATLNGVGPVHADLEKSSSTPNTARMGALHVTGERLQAVAWMADSLVRIEGTYDATEVVSLAVVTQADGTLRLDPFDREPVFD